MKEIVDEVIQAIKRVKRSNMEDLVSMQCVLKEFHLALGTFFSSRFRESTQLQKYFRARRNRVLGEHLAP